MSALDIYAEPVFDRRSSIICTIGPNTNSVDMMSKLIGAGMNVVRMNFSHGDHGYHKSVIDNAREAARLSVDGENVVAIALDTKGPEIRTGLVGGDGGDVELVAGSSAVVTSDDEWRERVDAEHVYVDYKNIAKVVGVGNLIYIDDGLLSFKVDEVVDALTLRCTVQNSGPLGSRKGVNLPDVDVDLPAVSEKDRADLLFGVEQGVDMVFASFIRKAADVEEVRAVLGEKGKGIAIISKIENHEGVRNFDEILKVTDGVMVARGDLGIEIAAQKVFLAQKMMIAKCNVAGKPVICATQMLESMTVNPRPTRAETSDVANAILEGADCVMLSGETAKGKYPIQAVTMMAEICREAESAYHYTSIYSELKLLTPLPLDTPETVASAAVNASNENHAAAIVVLSKSGRSARLVAKYRPTCPIMVVTRNAGTARRAHLYRGCYPLYDGADEPTASDTDPIDALQWQGDVDSRIVAGIRAAHQRNFVQPGDLIVAIQGWKSGRGYTNTLRILVVAPEFCN
jgi:pyruvate kinase